MVRSKLNFVEPPLWILENKFGGRVAQPFAVCMGFIA
jgi:hypothetical protein